MPEKEHLLEAGAEEFVPRFQVRASLLCVLLVRTTARSQFTRDCNGVSPYVQPLARVHCTAGELLSVLPLAPAARAATKVFVLSPHGSLYITMHLCRPLDWLCVVRQPLKSEVVCSTSLALSPVVVVPRLRLRQAGVRVHNVHTPTSR